MSANEQGEHSITPGAGGDVQDSPIWDMGLLTLEEEAGMGYYPEEGELCEPEALAEERVDLSESFSNQLEWGKTGKWDHVDECLWLAIGGLTGALEELSGIHEHDWPTRMKENFLMLDSIVMKIGQYIFDYYNSPLELEIPPEFEDLPEFEELRRVLDEEISFEEGYKKFVESDFLERLEQTLNPGFFRETVKRIAGKQRWRRRNPALN